MSQNRNLLMSSESTSNKLEWLVDFLKKDIARLEKAKEAEDKNNPNNLAEIWKSIYCLPNVYPLSYQL